MTAHTSLRPVTAVDATMLAALHGACFDDAWTAESFASLLASPATRGWILSPEPDAPPVGFLLVQCAADQADIVTIGVLPAARGQGIGRRLLAYFLSDICPELKIESVFLEVDEVNAPAISLYAGAGFSVTGRRDAYYSGTGKTGGTALVMSCQIK